MLVGDSKISISGGAEEPEPWRNKIATAIYFLEDMNDTSEPANETSPLNSPITTNSLTSSNSELQHANAPTILPIPTDTLLFIFSRCFQLCRFHNLIVHMDMVRGNYQFAVCSVQCAVCRVMNTETHKRETKLCA
ncbi:hypothetical protein VNO78_10771 [Psophocarpus tetragonolobus]|uniref:Uncharacterized protein n=1 Tax=Psophocarpus tetragonolobus TaxID=3891 RepID=A0AAN9SL67_PSOTE